MPVTLSLKTQQYIDPDANKIITGLPVLRSDYGVQDADIAFLRKFFRCNDTQTLMKIFRKLYMVECRRVSPLTRAVVAIAAKVYGNIRGSSHNPLVRELLQILAKPNFQALLYSHDKIAARDYGPNLDPDEEEPLRPEDEEYKVKVVQLIKANEPLGATLQYNDESGSLQVARIMMGGAADRSGLLHVGDEILNVGGHAVRDKTPDEVVNLLGQMAGPISLKVVSGKNNLVPLRESKMRVRAFFDYNPINDVLNPCPEAGLSFCRGDVLHIVSQEDPWWWQARKEGEVNGKTGLIPARQLQERNEMMRRYHSDEDLYNCSRRAARGPSPCRFSPKISRTRRIRKTMYQAQQSGGTPEHLSRDGIAMVCCITDMNRDKNEPDQCCFVHSLMDVFHYIFPKISGKKLTRKKDIEKNYDPEDIPTYEEVELFQPLSGQFRPVVIIGPPGVGRNELKRRIISFSPDRFQEVVPYTSRKKKPHEEDSREYHFIPREEMERGIINHRFVEFGEYKGNLYGTSYASIRSVINSGKICLLTPHTQSLKLLRSAEIKPYIIYIKPPHLEVLRMTRKLAKARKTLDSGETRLFTEEDLTDMLSIGARIEQKYCHYFDAVIVNDDIVKAAKQLYAVILELESKPQWVPITWLQ